MTTIDPSFTDLSGLKQQLIGRLDSFRKRVQAHLLLEGVARVLGEMVGLIFLSLFIDHWLRLSLPVRIGLLILALIGLGIEAYKHILLPLRMKLGPVALASAIDRASGTATLSSAGSIAARVATVLELPDLLAGHSPPSEAMIRQAVVRSHQSLSSVQFEEKLNHERMRYSVGAIAALLLLPIIFAVAKPAVAGLWAKRWLMGSNQPWPQKTYLQIAGLNDGRIAVPRGEPFTLRVTNTAGSEAPESVSIQWREGRGDSTTAQLTRFGPGDFRYDLPPLQSDAKVDIWGGDDLPPGFVITPVDRPRIAELTLTAQHPTQDHPEIHTFSGQDADFAFLPKTRLQLAFTTNTPVKEVHLKTASTQPSPADLRRIDDTHFAIGWTQEKPVQMEIELLAAAADLTSIPTPVSIGLKQDMPPRVTMRFTGVRQRITRRAKIPLSVSARDDYGVAKMELAWSALNTAAASNVTTGNKAGTTLLMGPANPATDLEVSQPYQLDVAALDLTPGYVLTVNGQAFDACYTGVQEGKSSPVSFHVVPDDELFREILLRQQNERTKFRKSLESAQKMKDQLTVLASPESAGRLLGQQRILQRDIAGIFTILSASKVEMQLNDLGSPETLGLMEKNVLTPIKTLNDDPMTRQKDALEALSRGMDAKLLAEATTRQDEIIAKMQEILKSMSQWDSFVDVLNQLNTIIDLQGKVKGSTEDLRKQQTDSLFEK